MNRYVRPIGIALVCVLLIGAPRLGRPAEWSAPAAADANARIAGKTLGTADAAIPVDEDDGFVMRFNSKPAAAQADREGKLRGAGISPRFARRGRLRLRTFPIGRFAAAWFGLRQRVRRPLLGAHGDPAACNELRHWRSPGRAKAPRLLRGRSRRSPPADRPKRKRRGLRNL